MPESLSGLSVNPFPLWVQVTPWVILFCLSFGSAWLVLTWTRLLVSKAARSIHQMDIHWTEKARLLWPLRTLTTTHRMFIVLLWIAAVVAQVIPGPAAGDHVRIAFFVVTIGTFWGSKGPYTKLLGLRLGRMIRPPFLFAQWLMSPNVLLLILFGLWPTRDLPSALAVTICFVVVATLFPYAAWLRLMEKLRLIRPLTLAYESRIQTSAAQKGLPPVNIRVLPFDFANAFAFLRSNTIAFTERATEVLSEDELVAIADHELEHLAEPKRIHFVRLFMTACLFAPILVVPALVAQSNSLGLIALLLVWIATLLIFVRTARKLEVHADEGAHHHGPHYANALLRIYQDNLIPAVLKGSKSHPDLYDRLVATGENPDFPKPLPPPKRLKLGLRRAVVGAGFVTVMTSIGILYAVNHSVASPETLDIRIAIFGGTDRLLIERARQFRESGHVADGHRALSLIRHTTFEAELERANLFSAAGDCAQALGLVEALSNNSSSAFQYRPELAERYIEAANLAADCRLERRPTTSDPLPTRTEP